MGFEIKYKQMDNKGFIKEQLNNIVATIRDEGQVDTESWAWYIDDTIKQENSTIEEIVHPNRMISIKLKQKMSACDVEFDDTIIDKGKTFRYFEKEELKEFIEVLQLAYEQL